MRDFFVRGTIAALLSTGGVVGTYYWAKSRQFSGAVSTSEPIAKLVASTNEVQRRPLQHLIWKSINTHEDLFSGEELRTAVNAEAYIEFVDQGVKVRLEGDSVIRIEKTGRTLSLGFLKGNLLITAQTTEPGSAAGGQKSSAEDAFVIQSGDRKISVGQAQVSLAKATAEGPLEIDVHKGQVKEIDTGKTPPKPESARIKILKPSPNEAIYAPPGTAALVSIEFQPIDASFEVAVEAGPNPRELAPVTEVAAVNGATGKIEVPMKPGRGYVKLKAKAATGEQQAMASATYRVEVRPRVPVALLEPEDKRPVKLGEEKGDIIFRWANPGQLVDLRLEIGDKPELEKPMHIQNVDGKTAHAMIIDNASGEFFWKVVGRLPGTEEFIPSETRSLHIAAKTAAPAVEEKPPEPPPIPELTWNDPYVGHEKLKYKAAKPKLKLAWEKGPEKAVKWRMRIADARQPASNDPSAWKEIDGTQYLATLEEPGTYLFEVVAIDESGEIVARSSQRSIAFEQVPPPGPPALAGTEKEIQARDDGSLEVSWGKVEDAKEYEVQLKAADGKVVKTERVSGTKSTFKKLKPGPYKLGLRSIDSLGRMGPESEPRSIRVPEYSEVRAPKIKNVNVK